MQQKMDPTISDNSLIIQWRFCRLIGIINKVYIGFLMFLSTLVIFVLANYCYVIKYYIITTVIWGKMSTNILYEFKILCGLSDQLTNSCWILIILVYALVHFQMFLVNDGLRSTSIPNNGEKLKTWLLYHYGYFLGISILFFIMLYKVPSEIHFCNIFLMAIIYTGLITEFYIVIKFKKELEISADRRNKGFQTSNI